MKRNSHLKIGNTSFRWRLSVVVLLSLASLVVVSACGSAGSSLTITPGSPIPVESSPTAESTAKEQARALVANMSLEEKVAQMFMVTPEALCQVNESVVASGEQTRQAFNNRPVGGVIYNSSNLQSPQQVKEMLANLQTYSNDRVQLPVFTAVDEEGGTVARVSGNPAMGIEPYPKMSEVGASKDTERALKIGAEMGQYLSDLGFNIDFAPDADVLTNPENALLKSRSFGSDAQTVSDMAAAFTKGLQKSSVLATYKHFPGHGSTNTDTHEGITISQQDPNQLDSVDLVPFKDAVSKDVKLIMVSHVSFPKVVGDNTPATLSRKVVTDLAREKLGYQGILITDAMAMGAISEIYQPADAAVAAIQAGNDIVLNPADFDAAYQGVLAAVQAGTISQEQIDQSVERIVTAKLELSSAN